MSEKRIQEKSTSAASWDGWREQETLRLYIYMVLFYSGNNSFVNTHGSPSRLSHYYRAGFSHY